MIAGLIFLAVLMLAVIGGPLALYAVNGYQHDDESEVNR